MLVPDICSKVNIVYNDWENGVKASRQIHNRKQLGCTYSCSLHKVVTMLTNLIGGFKILALFSCSTDKEDAGSLWSASRIWTPDDLQEWRSVIDQRKM
jgi:hypothetical protein